MNLFPDIEKAYTKDHLSAREAQRLAQYIAFGPIVFQASRLMLKFGILERLRDRDMTLPEIAEAAGLSEYAAKVLVEASLSIGTVLVDTATDKYSLSKTGWFLLNDPATRVNVDFNHDVNYEGFFHLEEALLEGRPAGLKHFGDWPTLYEGLSSLPEQVKKSWFGFDHFYSDHSFDEALEIVFRYRPKRLMDVGGNTGRWALRCVDYDPAGDDARADGRKARRGPHRRLCHGHAGSGVPVPAGPASRPHLDEPVPGLFQRGGDPGHPRPGCASDGAGIPARHHGNLLGPPEIRARLLLPHDDEPLFHRDGERQFQDVPF